VTTRDIGVPADAFFVPDGGRFVATPHTAGPWSPGFQHAGPPSALLARAIEHAAADDRALAVTRLTVELLAPIPLAAFDVQIDVLRAGRKVRRIDATLMTGGRAVARATGLAVRTARLEGPRPPAPAARPEGPERGAPYVFPVVTGEAMGYAVAVEGRRVPGATQPGGVAAWVRTRVALVAGEAPSPLQRVMIAADSGNGVAIPLDPRHFTFVNADLMVALHRPMEGEWVCLDAATVSEPSGIGLTTTRLWDVRGPIGQAFQTLVIEARDA
jgi:hypothetical protein